jgi:DNA polymerase-3 subunit beta
MKFTVSSRALYSTLSGVSKAINSKNTLTVLDNFLLELDADKGLLTVTASDTENTLVARLAVANADQSGRFLANAKRLCDIGKELPAVDVEIAVDLDSLAMQIDFPGGKFDLVALDANQYPVSSDPLAEIKPEEGDVPVELLLPSSVILSGIENTTFAVATDQIRPQLMGILWDIKPEKIIFVATDTRKLVKYENTAAKPGFERRLILPLKPAVLLKQLLAKEEDVKVTLTDKSATFTTERLTLSCRLIKGNFPPYERVIPADNPYVATFDRESILTAVRRVSVCADPAHGLMKLRFTHGLLEIKVDDTSHSTFAVEKVACDYTGRDIVIGFSAGYLIEIFNTLTTQNILMKLADPSRPGIFVPEENAANTELIIILMPMTVQDF